MSYTLEALLGRSPLLSVAAHGFAPASIIPRPQGINLLPLTDEVLSKLPSGDLAESSILLVDSHQLSPLVIHLAQALSQLGPVAYIEAEFFGGVGVQAAVGWQGGQIVVGPIRAADAINQALRWLGVVSSKGQDEFDVLDLGQHRSSAEWLTTEKSS